jgi:hypothetical protein
MYTMLVLCGEGSTANVAKFCSEVSRVLKPTGVFFIVSYGVPDNRLNYLEKEVCLQNPSHISYSVFLTHSHICIQHMCLLGPLLLERVGPHCAQTYCVRWVCMYVCMHTYTTILILILILIHILIHTILIHSHSLTHTHTNLLSQRPQCLRPRTRTACTISISALRGVLRKRADVRHMVYDIWCVHTTYRM